MPRTQRRDEAESAPPPKRRRLLIDADSPYKFPPPFSLFAPAAPPPTKLGRYRQLALRAGVHVSPLSLSLGTRDDSGIDAADREGSFRLLDAYYEAGGNCIDTTSNCEEGMSEKFLGEWVESRGIRDQLILATKYGGSPSRASSVTQKANYVGSNLKSMRLSLEASLANLRTSYIDIFYLSFWDLHTDIEEVMDGLHSFVAQGKVLYLGIADSPAWLVTKANAYARHRGQTPLVVYHASYSVLQRDIERDVLPMCRHEGIALTLRNTLAHGRIRTSSNDDVEMHEYDRVPVKSTICDALKVVAEQVGATQIAAVAIAYTMHKAPYIFPILGAQEMEAGLEALNVSLTAENIAYLDGIVPFDKGFPNTAIGEYGAYPFVLYAAAAFDPQPLVRPIEHVRG